MILLEIESIEAESHMIAIVMVVVVALLATIGITLDRCCTKADKTITDEEEYVFYLAEEQIKLFNAKLEPLAKEQAKQEVEELFEKYKDVSSDPAEKIRLISKEIEKKFPWMAVGTIWCVANVRDMSSIKLPNESQEIWWKLWYWSAVWNF